MQTERQLSANSAIVTIDHEGVIQSVDKGACQMFGYELEELMGQKVNVLLPTPYREQHDTYLAEYHRSGQKKVIGKCRLVEAQHKDGTIFPIRLSVSEVNVGDKSMYIGMLDRVEDSAGTITANHEGIIIFCNKNCEAIFGYTVGEMVGKNLNILMPSPHAEKHDSYLAEYHKTGRMKVIGHTRNVPAKHKNGTVFPICLQVTKLKVGVVDLFKGRVERVCNDCEAVFTLSKQGTIMSCNRNFVTPLFGYTDTELIGEHIGLLVPSLINPVEKVLSGKGKKRKRESTDDGADKGEGSGEDENGDDEEEGEKEQQTEGGGCPMRQVEKAVKEEEEEQGGRPLFEEDEDGPFAEEAQGGGCPVFKQDGGGMGSASSMQSDFSISGRRRLDVRHKDGSTFPVDFSISKFQQDDIVFYSGRIRRVSETPKEPLRSPSAPKKEEGSSSEFHSESLTFVGDYVVEGNVGQGSYGKVKLASHKLTGQKVAIKILQKDLMDNPEIVRSKREVEIQMKLSHPNIVKLFDVVETDDRIYIIMEYSEGGELLSYINQKGKLPDAEARRLFLQLLSAVQYCHRHNIIHRDIKHKNILLDADLNLKLIDFGLSNYIQFDHLRSTFCGTPAYAAPEMILAKKYIGPEVDIWSMGVVLYSMVCGRFPFGNVSNIIDGQFNIPSHLNPVLADLIKRMLVVDTSKRATISDVARHPWVQIGATSTIPSSPMHHVMSPDQISSFMAKSPPKIVPSSLPPQSAQQPSPQGGGCPVFHHSSAPPQPKKPLPNIAPDMSSSYARSGSPQQFTMNPHNMQHPHAPTMQHPIPPQMPHYVTSPHQPQNPHMPQPRKYPTLSPKFNVAAPNSMPIGFKYNPLMPQPGGGPPFLPQGMMHNQQQQQPQPPQQQHFQQQQQQHNNHQLSNGSDSSDLQDLLNRMRNPMVPSSPAPSQVSKSDVAALIESYGYAGVNFGRNVPPTKRRRENGQEPIDQQHQYQQQQPHHQQQQPHHQQQHSPQQSQHGRGSFNNGGLNSSHGAGSGSGEVGTVKDVMCNVVATDKQS